MDIIQIVIQTVPEKNRAKVTATVVGGTYHGLEGIGQTEGGALVSLGGKIDNAEFGGNGE